MAVLKCKMCGGSLEVSEGMTVSYRAGKEQGSYRSFAS